MTAFTRFSQLENGQSALLCRNFSHADIRAWQHLAGVDGRPDGIPEPLIAALFSCLLGERLPGHGTNYLKQQMQFTAMAKIDEPLSASVTITRLRADKALVNLDTLCTGADDRTICTGRALVLFKH